MNLCAVLCCSVLYCAMSCCCCHWSLACAYACALAFARAKEKETAKDRQSFTKFSLVVVVCSILSLSMLCNVLVAVWTELRTSAELTVCECVEKAQFSKKVDTHDTAYELLIFAVRKSDPRLHRRGLGRWAIARETDRSLNSFRGGSPAKFFLR